jgi:cohesin loading factor subunit SCC2
MKAVSQAFDYQRDVLHDTNGATTQPFTSKLHLLFEVLKTGNGKVRKKFLSNLCERINFELPKLSSKDDPPSSLLYARFCVQNLAFFDYARVDEILHLVSCLEKVVTGTGTVVAHAIETEILGIRLDLEPHLSQQVPSTSILGNQAVALPSTESDIVRPEPSIKNTVDESQLRHLTIATMILTMIWETRTFLRRQWGLHKQREGKASSKTTVKDLNRAPTKAPGVTGDKYWERISEIMSALNSPDTMTAQCKTFAELLAVDNELKIASEDDEEAELARAAAGYETPSDDENGGENVPLSGARGRKRKASISTTGTPKKARKTGTGKPRVRPRKNRNGSSVTPESDDRGWN